jgi:hypothetical protein
MSTASASPPVADRDAWTLLQPFAGLGWVITYREPGLWHADRQFSRAGSHTIVARTAGELAGKLREAGA